MTLYIYESLPEKVLMKNENESVIVVEKQPKTIDTILQNVRKPFKSTLTFQKGIKFGSRRQFYF